MPSIYSQALQLSPNLNPPTKREKKRSESIVEGSGISEMILLTHVPALLTFLPLEKERRCDGYTTGISLFVDETIV
jgi:hypothetical protein